MSARSLVACAWRCARAFAERVRARCLRHPHLFVRVCEPDDRELGHLGEEIAARHLIRAGFIVLGRRVRTPAGEVDVLARDGGEIVCVEVKAARILPVPRPRGAAPVHDMRWRPGARFTAERLARHVRAGRVDLVEVRFDVHERRFRVEHHRRLERPVR